MMNQAEGSSTATQTEGGHQEQQASAKPGITFELTDQAVSAAEAHHERSIVRLRNGELAAALDEIEEALKMNPHSISHNLQAAYVFRAHEDVDNANASLAYARSLVKANEGVLHQSLLDALQRCERYLNPFHHLPVEIITAILEQLQLAILKDLRDGYRQDDERRDPFLVLHISSRLRQLALGLRVLFQDLCVIIAYEGSTCLKGYQVECMEFCIRNSKGVITSLWLPRVCPSRFEWLLDIAEASSNTLTHLKIQSPIPRPSCQVCSSPPVQASDTWSVSLQKRIIDLIYAARKLHRLDLRLAALPDEEHLAAQSSLQTRPTSLRLKLPKESSSERPHPQFDRFVSTLLEKATDLELCARESFSSARLNPVDVWPIATAYAHALRTLRLELHSKYFYNLASCQAVDFPVLEELWLDGRWSYIGNEGDFVKFRTPRLVTLTTMTAYSLRVVFCPAVTLVNVELGFKDEPSRLLKWLTCCREVTNLELLVVPDSESTSSSEYWSGKFASPDIIDFHGVDLLTEILRALIPTAHGSVLCPKLHTLGVSCDENIKPYTGWTRRPPGWKDWLEEALTREPLPYGLGELWVTEEIVRVDKERRELSQGREFERKTPFTRCGQVQPSTPLTPAQVEAKWGKCVPLEKIYLRGCIVEEEVWKRLQKSPVEAICLPDPLMGGAQRIPVSKNARITHPWQEPEWD